MYPEICLQSFADNWWIENENRDYHIGRLLWAFIPHIDQVPATLTPEGRKEPTKHNTAKYRIEPLRANNPSKPPLLPVAALPSYPGEFRAVYRAKKRPVLVIGSGGVDIPKTLRQGFPKWQTSPTILVAPFYGADKIGYRAGWPQKLIDRIQRCEYPQYLWDKLPIHTETEESILRLDQIQPIGKHHFSLDWTKHRLSDEAITLLQKQITWLLWGRLPEDGDFLEIRELLLTL